MGTKNDPGPYDCYAHAAADEPIFILRGNDPTASLVVTFWVAMRRMRMGGREDEKFEEARKIARNMERWARDHDRGPDVETALEAFYEVIDAAKRTRRPSSFWRRLFGR